ncbi:MAG TPA: response regulator transcription factor [Chthoniobacterales bacterium]|jgi:two-component system response regulator NreC|nr:response regulator transcription factor [Chthoniobacterales bacterium]
MRRLRILVADDHEVMRTGVRALIEQEPGWQVCGTATNGQEAVEGARKLKPDVVVLDMTMPELDGLSALREIKHTVPNTEVVIFSAYHSEEVIEELFDSGAKSYIQKSDACRHLVAAIKSLAEHKPFFTSEISQILFAKFLSGSAGKKQNGQEHAVTSRERDVVRLLAGGNSNKEVANSLGISIRTAETHRATLMRKLGLESLAALVRYAIRNNIIDA